MQAARYSVAPIADSAKPLRLITLLLPYPTPPAHPAESDSATWPGQTTPDMPRPMASITIAPLQTAVPENRS
jgi:hypothetical protein